MKDEKAIVEIIIKGQQSNATVKQIEASARALSAQLKHLPTDSQKFIEKSKELAQVNTRLKSIRDEVRGVGDAFNKAKPESFFSKMKTGASSVFGGNLITMGAQAIVGVFNDAIDVHRKFESSLQNLSAITGATGADLDFYKQKAREMGIEVKGGSVAVIEAYKLIGSAKPELLENKEALVAVTESAILLSQAAGLELPEAATRLTDAMNQFGAEASEASKYVDILAAGAKYGAAEIPEVTDALLKFGVGAKSSNISIKESVAVIELLAEKGLKGAEAGTQLRNVFAKLSATSVLSPEAKAELKSAGVDIKKLEDKTIPLQERLKELSKIQGNAAAITRVFGLENKTAGETIIANLPRLEELNNKLGETGAASEQASTNINTFDQEVVKLKNSYDDLLVEITDGDFGEVIKGFVSKGTGALGLLKTTLHNTASVFKKGIGATIEENVQKDLFDHTVKVGKEMTLVQRLTHATIIKEQVKHINEKLQNAKTLSNSERENALQDIQRLTVVAGAYISIDKKIASSAVSEKQNSSDTVQKIDEDARKKLLAARKKFLEELEALERKYKNKFLSTQQIEEKELFEKYDKLLKQAKKGSEEEHFLRQSLVSDLTDLEKKYSDQAISEKEKFIAEYTKTIQTAEVNEIDESRKKYAELIKQAQEYGEDIKPLLEKQKEEEAEIRAKYNTRSDSKNTPNQFLGGGKEDWQVQFDEAISVYDQFASRINTILDGVKARNTARAEAEAAAHKSQMDEQVGREQRLLKSKVITQEQYDRRVETLDKERREKDIKAKQDAAQRNKKIALFQAVVSGAVSVARTLAEYSYPVNLVLAALDAAVVGMQISAIANQPIPSFAKGGYSNKPSGYVDSPTVFSNSASGQPFLAGEAGREFIVPNWMLQDPLVANNVEMLDAIRTRGYADGGYNTVSKGSSSSGGSKGDSVMGFGELAKMLGRLNDHLDNGLGVNYDQFVKTNKRIDNSKTAAQIG